MATPEPLIANSRPEIQAVFRRAADLVREVMPDAFQQLDLPDRELAFGFGPPGIAEQAHLRSAMVDR